MSIYKIVLFLYNEFEPEDPIMSTLKSLSIFQKKPLQNELDI